MKVTAQAFTTTVIKVEMDESQARDVLDDLGAYGSRWGFSGDGSRDFYEALKKQIRPNG